MIVTPAQVLPATHQAFGLFWHFPFSFPLFRVVPSDVPADVVVELGILPPPSPDARLAGPLRLAEPGKVRFGLPGVAKVLVTNGERILVERDPGGSEETLRLLLMGTVAALLLHQRGYLPLHGSGVVTPYGAVLFVGHSGVGKSTVLGALLKRGYSMICDDLAALRLDEDGVTRVCPGAPLYKLWADSAEALDLATTDLHRARLELEKFLVPVPDRQISVPVPVHAIYQLSTHHQPMVSFEPRDDAGRFNVLLDHTWQKLALKRMGLHGAHFQRTVALARTTRVVSVRRPSRKTVDVDELAERLEINFLTDLP